MTVLLAVNIRDEQGIVVARQRTRQVSELLGFDPQDQIRLATAASEVVRNAVQFGRGCRVEFGVAGRTLLINVQDNGPGIADPQAVLDGRAGSANGLGLVSARRLVDDLTIESQPQVGTTVRLKKTFARSGSVPTDQKLGQIIAELLKSSPEDPFSEVRQQNRDLLKTLDELRERETRLAELNRELEETNRGVMALYAELDEKAEAIRRVSDLKSRFLSNMSHEFRTPLNSIVSLTQLLLDRADGPLRDEQVKQVNFVRRAAVGLSELVNDLLDLAKVEAGKVVVRPNTFLAADLFAALRGMMRPLTTGDGVALTFDDAAAVGALHTDEGKVAQILRNFLSNALKFTEHGEVRLTALAHADGTIQFAVSDTGIGIAACDRERIFEEFGQIENAVQSKVKGTGLGLPLSKRLAELLGGRVWLTSEPGVGSTFYLSLPRNYSAPTAGTPGERSRRAESTRPTFLLIDDDEIARYLLRGLLENGTVNLVEAEGGRDGVRQAKLHHPRAIFLDLMMPDLSGFDTLDQLKADPDTRDTPVFVYTSHTPSAAEQARLAGKVAGILAKAPTASREAAGRVVWEALEHAGIAPPRVTHA
ncbi:ATP-binding protein [Limnoglobus roseus]|uniref:histidine kinase n=1 Tax=Limnoglobus roseus TaxID=2598579 RepID=A0A5C1APY2_9BACT|nr:ATP-binding protein [Limnoglobus roseus]QEL20227.1 histidine kinase [Limnoglobus roseus]